MEYEDYKDSDLKQFRKIGNSRMDIYQTYEEPVFRDCKNNSKLYTFQNSFEHDKIKNDSIKILSNASNSLIFSLVNNDSMIKTNHLMKKLMTIEDVSKKENKIENFKSKYKVFVKRIRKNQLKDDEEFRCLSQFIENPKFDEIMRSDKRILKAILKHKYLKFHDQYKRIIKTYSVILKSDITNTNLEQDDNEGSEEDQYQEENHINDN